MFYNDDGLFYADKNIRIANNYNLNENEESIIIKTIIENTEYPKLLSENGISGLIIVKFNIDTSGKIESYKLIKTRHISLERPIKDLVNKINLSIETVSEMRKITDSKLLSNFIVAFNFGYDVVESKYFKDGIIQILVKRPYLRTGKK
jgi:hypothetical protein